MTDNFKETVNLKAGRKTGLGAKNSRVGDSKFTKQIDRVYDNSGRERKELQKISRPLERRINEPIFKRIIILLAIILISFVIYFLFFNKNNEANDADSLNWYSVKLVDGEIFYGQIKDITSDPIVINNVYYNYDQQKENNNEVNKTDSLRLVKRGKETHGPDGTLNVVRMQILYMEPLKSDSKVLEAILNYEK